MPWLRRADDMAGQLADGFGAGYGRGSARRPVIGHQQDHQPVFLQRTGALTVPRNYNVTFEAVSVTAARDLVQVKGAAGKIFRPIRAWVKATDTTLPTAQMLQTRCRFLPTTVSDGSGGQRRRRTRPIPATRRHRSPRLPTTRARPPRTARRLYWTRAATISIQGTTSPSWCGLRSARANHSCSSCSRP